MSWNNQPQAGYYPPPPGGPPQMQPPNSYAPNQSYGYAPQGPYNQAPPQQAQMQAAGGPGGYAPQGNGYGDDSKMALAPEGFQGEKFAPAKPKFRDPFFAILFILVFGGYIAVSVISLRGYISSGANEEIGRNGGIGATLNGHTAILLMFTCAVALFFSVIYIILVRVFTKFILEATLLLSVIITIAWCVFLWVTGQTAGAIVMTIFAVLAVVSYFFMRKRIPLAKLLLRTIIRAANEHKSVYLVGFIGLIVQTAMTVWIAWTLVAVYQRFDPGSTYQGSNKTSATVTGLVVFTIFAAYWITEVIKSLFYTTIAGIYGTWFYNMGPKAAHAALSSFKRASTYSLGSICFGSLILALLDMLRALINVVQQQQAQEGDMVGIIFSCIASCLVALIDWAATYFQRIGLIHIALYGDSFIESSKQTWRLIKQKGIDILINDSLVGTVFTIGSYGIALLSGIFAYGYLYVTNPPYVQANSNYLPVILLYSVLLGLQIALTLGMSLQVGVSTYFVALAESPEVVAQKDPELFNAIRQAYPQVVVPV